MASSTASTTPYVTNPFDQLLNASSSANVVTKPFAQLLNASSSAGSVTNPFIEPSNATIVATETFGNSVPLTTIFTPARKCYHGNLWTSSASTQGTITCTSSLASDCYPEFYYEINAVLKDLPGLYSPGVCPSGYDVGGNWTAKGYNARTYICCPRGMSYLQYASSCSTIISTGAEIVISDHLTTYSSPFTAFASTIAVAWASSDLPLFTPASAPLVQARLAASASRASASDSQATTSEPSNGTSSSPMSSGFLSTGAQAGIGVGVSIAGIILLALGMWALLRRRQSRTRNDEPRADPRAGLRGEDAEKKLPGVAELGNYGAKAELAGLTKPTELDRNERHELEGHWHGHEIQGVVSPLGRMREAGT